MATTAVRWFSCPHNGNTQSTLWYIKLFVYKHKISNIISYVCNKHIFYCTLLFRQNFIKKIPTSKEAALSSDSGKLQQNDTLNISFTFFNSTVIQNPSESISIKASLFSLHLLSTFFFLMLKTRRLPFFHVCKTSCISQQQNRNNPISFKLVFYKQKRFLHAGGKCTINKYYTHIFVTACCIPTGIKHQSGNTVDNSSGSSFNEKTIGFADASHISWQTGPMPWWKINTTQ